MEALDIIVQTLGFRDWKHYLESDVSPELNTAVRWLCEIHKVEYHGSI